MKIFKWYCQEKLVMDHILTNKAVALLVTKINFILSYFNCLDSLRFYSKYKWLDEKIDEVLEYSINLHALYCRLSAILKECWEGGQMINN